MDTLIWILDLIAIINSAVAIVLCINITRRTKE